jgi:hypothetical protein
VLGGLGIDVEDREAAPFTDARAQQAHATGIVVVLLQLDFLSTKGHPESV